MDTAIESNCEPITVWIRRLELGQAEAAQPLWDHFCKRLMDMANVRLGNKLKRTYDEEDVAVSAFHSLCRAIAVNDRVCLGDRIDLWKLLVVITERKIANRARKESRRRRDMHRTISESALAQSTDIAFGLDHFEGREPSPEFATDFADLCGSLLDSLNDDALRDVARLKLRGLDTREIAHQLDCSRRTVERRLLIIRRKWEQAIQE